MATKRHSNRVASLVAQPDEPLIGIVFMENGQELTYYFTDEADADAAVAEHGALDPRAFAGIWSDLDWDELEEALYRIRHDSTPTPPIDDL